MRYSFFLILLIPLAAQAYVSLRLCQVLPIPVWGKVLVVIAMLVAFGLSLFAVLPQLDRLPMPISTLCYHIGTSWLLILLYLFMLILLLDVFRLCHLVPSSFFHHNWIASCTILGTVTLVFIYGYLHYHHKERVSLQLTTTKFLQHPMRVVMTSDWHLGYHNRRAELARWIDMINAEHPDVVLIAGDIIDRSIRPLDEDGMAAEFHRLQAPVYACLGNHEYYSGELAALRFYNEAGIHLLRDSIARIGDLAIIGRDDRTHHRRQPLSKLMVTHLSSQEASSSNEDSLSTQPFVILLDHQPYHLEEAETAGIDFQLSGHTHHGQVWPISWITDRLYECAFGPHQRGNTRYYVSSGLGIWGGKFRIGTQSEYIVADISTQS